MREATTLAINIHLISFLWQRRPWLFADFRDIKTTELVVLLLLSFFFPYKVEKLENGEDVDGEERKCSSFLSLFFLR